MAVTDQIISISAIGQLGPLDTRIVGDDWPFNFSFADDLGVALDMSPWTFSATLITESPYTSTAITGGNGSVNATQAASGVVVVAVADALTSTLTPDLDSVDTVGWVTGFNTRLVLVGDHAGEVTTWAIIPIRVVRR